LPERPAIEVCPTKVIVEGKIVDETIVLALSDAQRLRDWINAYIVCSESNQAKYNGHIEKLENRLKAVGGK